MNKYIKIGILVFSLGASVFAEELYAVSSEDSTTHKTQNAEYNLSYTNSYNSTQVDDKPSKTLSDTSSFDKLEHATLQPFGHNLFTSQCKTTSHIHYINPDYLIASGDKLSIQIWGAFEFSQDMVVDNQGNIFLPEIGPVHLQNVKSKELNTILNKHLKSVFLNDVHIYGDLKTAQPIQVYVTGQVESPGLHDGWSSDSVIYYLCQANGIKAHQGSYRDIKVLRNGQALRQIDLYDFITEGNIDNFQLQQGDVILVAPLKNVISINGDIKNSNRFELKNSTIALSELMKLANLSPSVNYVRLERNSDGVANIDYLPVELFKNKKIHTGDHLVFIADQNTDNILVTVTGEMTGPHQYILERGQNLETLLKKVHYTDQSDRANTQLFRENIAKQQKLAVESSLNRLERQALTSTNITSEGRKAQLAQANLVTQFIHEAKNVDFKGQMVLGEQQNWDRVILSNNDVVNIPRINDPITVGGEVLNAVSVETEPGKRPIDYINDAGGFSKSADKDSILIIHKNGKSELANSRTSSSHIYNGDQIIVLSEPPSENWQLSESLSKIMYQVALAAKVAILL